MLLVCVSLIYRYLQRNSAFADLAYGKKFHNFNSAFADLAYGKNSIILALEVGSLYTTCSAVNHLVEFVLLCS